MRKLTLALAAIGALAAAVAPSFANRQPPGRGSGGPSWQCVADGVNHKLGPKSFWVTNPTRASASSAAINTCVNYGYKRRECTIQFCKKQ